MSTYGPKQNLSKLVLDFQEMFHEIRLRFFRNNLKTYILKPKSLDPEHRVDFNYFIAKLEELSANLEKHEDEPLTPNAHEALLVLAPELSFWFSDKTISSIKNFIEPKSLAEAASAESEEDVMFDFNI
ncbi:MAG: hypothetical protein JSR17_09745 [Proteobacteria bacterium]|nr:hypothetical protein [Pseudomonadota bacterium]